MRGLTRRIARVEAAQAHLSERHWWYACARVLQAHEPDSRPPWSGHELELAYAELLEKLARGERRLPPFEEYEPWLQEWWAEASGWLAEAGLWPPPKENR